MKDWSDLEEKYQDMRLADPKAAQSFKQRMTARFQVCKVDHSLTSTSLVVYFFFKKEVEKLFVYFSILVLIFFSFLFPFLFPYNSSNIHSIFNYFVFEF